MAEALHGQIPWTSPEVAAQLSTWAKLKSSGCTNTDVLTKTNNLGDFETGKAAMMIDGTWDTQKFTKALGSKVAAFVAAVLEQPHQGRRGLRGRRPVDDHLHQAPRRRRSS